MKNNRRIVALLLSIAMMVSMIPATVMADEEEEVFPEEIVETGYEPEGEQEEQLPEEQAEDETVPDEDGSPADEEVPVEVPEEEPVEEPADIVVDEIIDITDIDEVEIPAADGKTPVIDPVMQYTEYVDETGTPQYLTEEVTELTGKERTLDSGWYIADGEIDFPLPVTVYGDVKIILADGCDVDAVQFASSSADDTIRFYGQRNGNGMIHISCDGVNDGIDVEYVYFNGGMVIIGQNGLNDAIRAQLVTINRGDIQLICGADDNDSITGIQTLSLTMRGGSLSILDFGIGIEGTADGDIIIAGGDCVVNGSDYGILAPSPTTVYLIGGRTAIDAATAGIEAYGVSDVYLGCAASTDSINVSSYDVNHDLTVDSNIMLTAREIPGSEYHGVLTDEEIAAINGKTLVRSESSVTYIDEYGNEQTVQSPNYLNGYETVLDEGYYVAVRSQNLGKVSISGDVKIILTNGCELTTEGFTHTPDGRPDGRPAQCMESTVTTILTIHICIALRQASMSMQLISSEVQLRSMPTLVYR